MEEKVQKSIVDVSLDRELDLVVAYKKAMQLAELSGLNFTEQTKFATAVSEIGRNALSHAGGGSVAFYISKEGSHYYVEAVVTDTGPGIRDLGALLEKISTQPDGQRTGIYNCKRLSDRFEMSSSEGSGTCVRIGRRLTANHPPINHMILAGWRKHFSQLAPTSPYDELKRQNDLLLKTLEELRLSKAQTQEQLEEIQSLNLGLEQQNARNQQLSNERAQQNELLKKRNEELDEFAHIVSHDLKAPLRNMKALIQLMEKGRMHNPAESMEMMKNQLQKMEVLIENVLTYSRTGHEKLDKTQVNLNKLLEELVAGLSRPQTFSIEIEPDFPIIYAEEILIYQVFSNLIINAIKYNDKEAGHITIGYEPTDSKGNFYYYVEDNGLGIPASKREKVFKLFSVLHKLEGVESTGIGLAIVKKIILEKGGQIWIEDPRLSSEGSRFCFTWPAETIL
ncbi:sensor histidine kinase [Cesiribacter andamanensis]|uniref:histidine kinase n=1 Tax=Cesiribacter andamanensis AMV16 TaxID=1279009 RepID=M7NI59_9BACT|nr:sensor histidine kinase [Cesiribacter andamanensis]EMR01490.1 Phytochrome-like protein cph1 [Cesiribacter andamanensis AMV16]